MGKWVLRGPLEEVLKPIQKNIFTLTSEDWLDIPEVQYIKHDIKLSKQEQTEYMRLNSQCYTLILMMLLFQLKSKLNLQNFKHCVMGLFTTPKTSEAFRS